MLPGTIDSVILETSRSDTFAGEVMVIGSMSNDDSLSSEIVLFLHVKSGFWS